MRRALNKDDVGLVRFYLSQQVGCTVFLLDDLKDLPYLADLLLIDGVDDDCDSAMGLLCNIKMQLIYFFPKKMLQIV